MAGAGLQSYRLSEPFRSADRWRFYLDVSDARLALFVPRSPLVAGSVSRIAAEQRGGGVRILVESRAYGGYGFQVVNDTLVVWLTDERSARGAAAEPPQAAITARSGRAR